MGTSGEELERLLANAGWVRALGVELVGASEADDLVQDAWVVALERSGAARNPAGWLAGVVRKLAGRRRRGAERRVRRERAVARPEGQPAADELVVEAELQRALIRAVTELDEPYRSTVLLRFYRGWTPQEIARSAGVPGATVRTRLARALARLRERLDREHGGRETWALVLTGPAGWGVAGGGTITGGALMGAKATISAAAALAAVAGWALWQGRDAGEGGSARRESDVAAADAVAGADTGALSPESARTTGDESSRERLAPASSATLASEVLLYGTVLDERGEPVELESLDIEEARIVVASASRPSAGSYSVAGLPHGRYTLVARARGFVSLREELELRREREHERHDLVLEGALSIPVKLLDENGVLIAYDDTPVRPRLEVVATRTAPEGALCGLRSNPGTLHGCGEFARNSVFRPVPELPLGYSGLLRLRVAPPVYVSVVLRDATLATQRVEGPLAELVFTIERAHLEGQLGGIRARFVDALTGQPILGGQAGLDPPSTYSNGGIPLDEQGSATLLGRAPGLYGLRFFRDGYDELSRGVRVPVGRVEDIGDVPVWPAAKLRGTVLDAEGQSVVATIRVIPRDVLRGPGDLEAGTSRMVTGGFELDKVARAPVQLFARVQGHALLSRTIDASSGLVEGLVLQADAGVRVVLRAPREPVGRQLTLADSSGLPLETHTLGEGRLVTTRLVPGRYQVWFGEAERVDSVEELVVGGEPLDLVVGSGR